MNFIYCVLFNYVWFTIHTYWSGFRTGYLKKHVLHLGFFTIGLFE